MGGAINSAVCALAAVILYGTGHPVLFSIALVNAIIEFASWRHMCYFAKMLTRDRRDRRDIPDWITTVNILAFVAGIVLLLWGGVIYLRCPTSEVRVRQAQNLTRAITVIFAGFINFLVISNLVDIALYKLGFALAKPSGDELIDALQLQPSRERHLVLNVVRPIVSSLIIFGGGSIVVAWLGLAFWGAAVSFAYFFFLTQVACLAGRKLSLNIAGWAMVLTMVCILLAYNLFK